MSAFTIESARIERATAVHKSTGARILDLYGQKAAYDGIAGEFPVSGDMIAVLARGGRHAARRRRERAARVLSEHEASA